MKKMLLGIFLLLLSIWCLVWGWATKTVFIIYAGLFLLVPAVISFIGGYHPVKKTADKTALPQKVCAYMNHIRKAIPEDLARIAEIEVFNYRLNFYPIFQNDRFYFEELQVPKQIEACKGSIDRIWVYDDGVVKGFIHVDGQQVKKLFVEPVFQNQSIGTALLEFAIAEMDVSFLWALEKNVKAVAFYERHGFRVTEDKMLEPDTSEYLLRLER